MMRQLPMVFKWKAGVNYPVGRIISHNNVNYRVRAAHTSTSTQPPTARFDLWERVNNNDGTWAPQIIYAIMDRVLHAGLLYEAKHVHQALAGQTPNSHPELWEPLPMTAKGQLVKWCDPNDPDQAPFFQIGQNGTEDEARAVLARALTIAHRVDPMPSAGITENATQFTLADGDTFSPAPVPGTAYYETMSALLTITVPSNPAPGQTVTVNGRRMKPGTNYPLPPMRHEGYLIKTTRGAAFTAR